MKYTLIALLGVAQSVKIGGINTQPNRGKNPNPNLQSAIVAPPSLHENEDYHSGPDPLSGVPYLTST